MTEKGALRNVDDGPIFPLREIGEKHANLLVNNQFKTTRLFIILGSMRNEGVVFVLLVRFLCVSHGSPAVSLDMDVVESLTREVRIPSRDTPDLAVAG